MILSSIAFDVRRVEAVNTLHHIQPVKILQQILLQISRQPYSSFLPTFDNRCVVRTTCDSTHLLVLSSPSEFILDLLQSWLLCAASRQVVLSLLSFQLWCDKWLVSSFSFVSTTVCVRSISVLELVGEVSCVVGRLHDGRSAADTGVRACSRG